jgi:hypothetical protein
MTNCIVNCMMRYSRTSTGNPLHRKAPDRPDYRASPHAADHGDEMLLVMAREAKLMDKAQCVGFVNAIEVELKDWGIM